MSLHRSGIARKSQLVRAKPLPRAKRERAARVKATAVRRRDTGPTPAQRALVAERAGYCCELCPTVLHDGDGWIADHSFHHRQARGMGSSRRPETNAAYNLLLLCGSATTPGGCHEFVEKHRTAAEAEGWLVRHGQDPAEVPVTLYAGARLGVDAATHRVLLTAGGECQEVPTGD